MDKVDSKEKNEAEEPVLLPFRRFQKKLAETCKDPKHREGACNSCVYKFPEYLSRHTAARLAKTDAPVPVCNHPAGRCDNCLPPSCHLRAQPFRRVDFVVFADNRKIQTLVAQWQQDLSCAFVVFLYGRLVDETSDAYPQTVRAEILAVSEKVVMRRLLDKLGLCLLGVARAVLPGSAAASRDVNMTADHLLRDASFALADSETRALRPPRPFVSVFFRFDPRHTIETSAFTLSDQALALVKTGVLAPALRHPGKAVFERRETNSVNAAAENRPEPGNAEERRVLFEEGCWPTVSLHGSEVRYVDREYFERPEVADKYEVHTEFFLLPCVVTQLAISKPLFKYCEFAEGLDTEYLKTFLANNLEQKDLLNDFALLVEVADFIEDDVLTDICETIKRGDEVGASYNSSLLSLFF